MLIDVLVRMIEVFSDEFVVVFAAKVFDAVLELNALLLHRQHLDSMIDVMPLYVVIAFSIVDRSRRLIQFFRNNSVGQGASNVELKNDVIPS